MVDERPGASQRVETSDEIAAVLEAHVDAERARRIRHGELDLASGILLELRQHQSLQSPVADIDGPQAIRADGQAVVRQLLDDALDLRALRATRLGGPPEQDDVLLDLPFLASAGTEYWLSIYAFSPIPTPDEAQWTWVGGTGGDGVALQFSGFDPNFRAVTTDRAFALTVSVPEPASLTLLVIGLLAAGTARRYRAS